ADDRGVAVSGKSHGLSLLCSADGTGADEFRALLRPDRAVPGVDPSGADPTRHRQRTIVVTTDDGRASISPETDRTALIGVCAARARAYEFRALLNELRASGRPQNE